MSEKFSPKSETNQSDLNGWKDISREVHTWPEPLQEIALEHLEYLGIKTEYNPVETLPDARGVGTEFGISGEILANSTDGAEGLENDENGFVDKSGQIHEAVHSLETLRTNPLLSLAINGMGVNFTELGHYAPKIKSSQEVYKIPDHLMEILKDDIGVSMLTYKNTIEQEDWKEKLFEQIQNFIFHDIHGNKLAKDLQITSLLELTPEQAVKLSLGMVQALSKYSYDDMGVAADKTNTMSLLRMGALRVNDSSWKGNGVCRNVASNVKAVFEALKSQQYESNMLNNTYSVQVGAGRGRSYGIRNRDNTKGSNKEEWGNSGHAWNTFVTIGGNGDSMITTVDATWALGRSKDGILQESDFTLERIYETAAELALHADNKFQVAVDMTKYLSRFVSKAKGEAKGIIQERIEFAFTEWIKSADIMLASEEKLVITPTFDVFSAAYKLRDRLHKQEIEILFAVVKSQDCMDKEGDRMSSIIDAYLSRFSDDKYAILVQDDQLQRIIFDKLGDKIKQHITKDRLTDGKLRMRLKQVSSNLL